MLNNKALEHFKTISYHKLLVMKGCFALGLYVQGITHDLSKYMPSEFLVGVRYYQGTRSPNNAEREELGYSNAWIHHKGRNKHHYEYWFDYSAKHGGLVPVEMPVKYVVEMFVDRIAAGKVYNGKNYRDSHPLAYYQNGNTAQFLHPNTAKLLERLLTMLAECGEERTFHYIRKHILHR